MGSTLLLEERRLLSENAFVEMVVWRLGKPLLKSSHPYKYRLALVVDGKCLLRYDNEAGKGDHKHIGGVEFPYVFSTNTVHLWNGSCEIGSPSFSMGK
ncbi:MAG: DUF6516 family protein [Desulfococcaceae bacterium]